MVVYSKKKKALKAHCDSVDCPIVLVRVTAPGKNSYIWNI